MNLPEYLHKHPLTKGTYPRADVQKIRVHAFQKAVEKKLTRSEKQNRYYWGVVLKTIGDDIGYLPDEVHQLMAKEFLRYEKAPGEVFVRSTASLKTGEFEEYMSHVRRFAATELNILVPKPNETEFSYEVK